METVNFYGQECVVFGNKVIQLLITRSVGPRILSLKFTGGENLLAEMPDFITDCPGSGIYHFYGGHRLWHAPEVPSRTYLPDDSPVDITLVENTLHIVQEVESKTGLQKSFDIQMQGDCASLSITHRLTNKGLWPATTALWAITQFKLGGVGILPQTVENTGVLPNRRLTFWPYTDPSEPAVHLGKNYILINANMQGAFKVGFSNPRGWQAYWWNGILFVKRAKYEADAEYFDYGSSSESYCNHQILELETLSPVTTIEPGAEATHVETWEMYQGIERPKNEQDVQALVERLELE